MIDRIRYLGSLFIIGLCIPLKILSFHHLGVYGSVFPIIESNLKTLIAEQFNQIDWHAFRLARQREAHRWGDVLPKTLMKTTENTHVVYWDPKVYIPSLGRWINPLDYVKPFLVFFIFNPYDMRQLDIASHLLKHYKHRIGLIIVKGNPIQLIKQYRIPLYYAYPRFINRFQLDSVPLLLGVNRQSYVPHNLVKIYLNPKLYLDKVYDLCHRYFQF